MSLLPDFLATLPAMDRSDVWAISLVAAVLLFSPFVVWMIVDCARHESLQNDSLKHVWLLIILFAPGGSVIYFFARKLPRASRARPRR